MTPAKTLAAIDQASNMHSSPKVAANIVNRILLAKSSGKGTMGLNNSHDTIIKVEDPCDEQITAQADASDIRVTEDPEATDYSSSFDGTVSGTENCAEMSDAEVESCFGGDSGFPFDGFSSVFPMRKKKLTTHWRRFVRPLMWRCKWTELKIKQFQSQASKYSRELAAYDQKQLELDHLTAENFGSNSLPFTVQSHGNKTMKRRKRKRVEDTTDVTLYMSQHKLFSYNESKKSDPDSFAAEECSNPVSAEKNNTSRDECGTCSDSSFYEPRDDNESLEEILHKIETVHSHVHNLKSQLVAVIGENGMKLSSSENLSLLVPCDGQNSSAHSPTFSACNGHTTSLGALNIPNQNLSEYDIGDFIMPDSMFSSYEEGIFVPDIIESTVSVLSSADVTMHQSQIGDSCEDIMDNVHIHYQQAEIEIKQTTEKQHDPEGSGQEESSDPSPFPASEPDLMPVTSTVNEQSRLTSGLGSEIHFPKSKRKRGERKAGSANWSR